MFKQFSILVTILIFTSCGKSLPELENLDLSAWQKDKNACGAYRTNNVEALQNQKEKLLALKEAQIMELLGRPDRNELFKRNQKFFYYYLLPSPDCPNASAKSKRLAIRFNAMGLAKEVAVE